MTTRQRFSSTEEGGLRHSNVLVGALLLMVFYIALGFALRYPVDRSAVLVSGDEHHYLTQSVSLIDDGDLVVRNNYVNGDYLEFYHTELDPSLWNLIGSAGYSGHSPGAGVLATPGLWVGAWLGVIASLAAAIALAFGLTAFTYSRLSGTQASNYGLLVLGAGFLALPLVPYSHTLYPETFMTPLVAAIALCAVVGLQAPRRSSRLGASLTGISLAALSLGLHPKFAVFLVGVTLFFVGMEICLGSIRDRMTYAAGLAHLTLAGVWLVGFSWLHEIMWSQFSPFGWFSQVRTSMGVTPSRAVVQLLDQFFGIEIGLFALVPLALLLLPFLILAGHQPRTASRTGLAILILVSVVTIAGPAAYSRVWTAGDVPFARYATPLVPIILLGGAYLVSGVTRTKTRSAFIAFLATIGVLQTLAYAALPLEFRPRQDGLGGLPGILSDRLAWLPSVEEWVWSAAAPSPWWLSTVIWILLIALATWLFGPRAKKDPALAERF